MLEFYDGLHATPKPADAGPIFLGIRNLTADGGLDLSDVRHIAEEDFAKWTRRIQPQSGDIVFSYEATLNLYAIIPEGFRGCLGRRLALIKPNPEVVDTRFLFCYFFGAAWRGIIATNMISGATVDRVPLIRFPDFEVRLPPLPTQRRIASILSAYDDLIENNTRRIKILEEVARLIYREWFVNFRFPGYERAKMKGGVPEEWEVKRLADVCSLVMGQSPESKYYNEDGDGLPFHQGVTDFGYWYPQDRIYCTAENRIAERGDILFSVRAPVGRINVANKKIVIGRGLSAIRSTLGNQAFLLQQLKEKFQEEDTMGGGTIFKSVTKEDMQGIELLVPAELYIKRFEELAVAVFREIEILTTKNANLRQTRDLLLPKLVSGEVDVSDLEIET